MELKDWEKDWQDSSGRLISYAWPGGYPVVYYDHDGESICPKCANDDDWSDKALIGADIWEEGPTLQCANCNAEIESAYGDPDEPQDETSKYRDDPSRR